MTSQETASGVVAPASSSGSPSSATNSPTPQKRRKPGAAGERENSNKRRRRGPPSAAGTKAPRTRKKTKQKAAAAEPDDGDAALSPQKPFRLPDIVTQANLKPTMGGCGLSLWPSTTVETKQGQSPHFAFAMATMQGRRPQQEDAFILENNVLAPSEGYGFFAVLDGHGGKFIAEESGKSLLPQIALHVDPVRECVQSTLKALRRAFIEHDAALAEKIDASNFGAGSTCASVLVTPTHILFANLGDSRAMLVRNGTLVYATEDHKPHHEAESKRICAAGGKVFFNRVDGDLATSRAFGDFHLKMRSDLPARQQKVSPEPDTFAVPRVQGSQEFLLLACDGVWDVMSNQAAVAYVLYQLRTHGFTADGARAAAEALVQQSYEMMSMDNISAIVVVLRSDDPMSVPS